MVIYFALPRPSTTGCTVHDDTMYDGAGGTSDLYLDWSTWVCTYHITLTLYSHLVILFTSIYPIPTSFCSRLNRGDAGRVVHAVETMTEKEL